MRIDGGSDLFVAVRAAKSRCDQSFLRSRRRVKRIRQGQRRTDATAGIIGGWENVNFFKYVLPAQVAVHGAIERTPTAHDKVLLASQFLDTFSQTTTDRLQGVLHRSRKISVMRDVI